MPRAQRDRLQSDGARPSLDLEAHVLPAGRPAFLACLAEQLAERVTELGTDHLQDVDAHVPRRQLEERARAAACSHDAKIAIHDHRRRGVAIEQEAVGVVLSLPDRIHARPLADVPLEGPRGRGEQRQQRLGLVVTAVDLLDVKLELLDGEREEIRTRAYGLGAAQHQHPLGLERVVEDTQNLSLHRLVQVDEHIAADDEIELGERGIPGHVLSREDATLADLFVDAIAAVEPAEEPAESLLRDVGGDPCRVDARAGPLDRALAHVGPEDLEGDGLGAIAQHLHQRRWRGSRPLRRSNIREPRYGSGTPFDGQRASAGRSAPGALDRRTDRGRTR